MDCCKNINRKTFLYIFPLLFGVSAWLGIYATFLQMPTIVKDAPEGWSLPSYIVVVIQIGNLGPLFYTLLQKYKPVKDSYLIYGMLTLGIIGAILFASMYDETSNFLGQERSLFLLSAVFLFAFMACSSTVLFMPYMGRFPESYMLSYLTGVSGGGLVASTATLIQGVGSDDTICHTINVTTIEKHTEHYVTDLPYFSVRTFFFVISSIFIVSSISFYLLDNLRLFKNEHANVTIRYGNDYTFNTVETNNESNKEVTYNLNKPDNDVDVDNNAIKEEEKLKKISPINYRNLTLLACTISFAFNALLPSILSYATLPFGSHTYHYAITFTYIGEPLAYILSNFIPHSSIRVIWILSVLAVFPCIYVGINAVLSPYPLLLGTVIGSVIVVNYIKFFSIYLIYKKKISITGYLLDTC